MTSQTMTEGTPITDEWLRVQTFDAAMTEERGISIGRIQQEGDAEHGVAFRMSLGVLMRSCDFLMRNSQDDPEESATAWLEAVERVIASVDQRKREIELMESAVARMHVLCSRCCALGDDNEVQA